MRRVLLLAVAVAIAGIGVLATSGADSSHPPAATIASVPLDPTAPGTGAAAATAPLVAAPPPPPPPITLALDQLTRDGDHFVAPTSDGHRATLTLDPALQDEAERLLVEARAPRAAIVAIAPDGRVLALAGRASDDPKGGRGSDDLSLALSAWAPAASIFKLVTASALVAGGVSPDDKVCYHGGLRQIGDSNLVDGPRDHDCQSLLFGVAHSNNAIVGKLAYQHLQPDALVTMAHTLGLDAPPPGAIALPAPLAQLALPATHDLAFAQAAAGFSDSRLSALGGALLAATFANAGEQPTVRLIDAIDGGAPVVSPAARRVLPADVASAVARMMVASCEVGSASRAFGRHRKFTTAGKTGTLTKTDPFYMEHSWFVGYAPVDAPEVIVAVVLGNGESWQLRGQEAGRRMIDRAIHRAPDRGGEPNAKQRARDR
jgi:penicillin-binding protein A